MTSANATEFNRKSGVAEWRDLLFYPNLSYSPPQLQPHLYEFLISRLHPLSTVAFH